MSQLSNNPLNVKQTQHRFFGAIDDAGDLTRLRTVWEQGKLNPISSAYKQRFGQWIYNNYEVSRKPWSHLFYETNTQAAFNTVLDEIYNHTNKV